MNLSFFFFKYVQSNKSLESNLEALADLVNNEISEFRDTILRAICKW